MNAAVGALFFSFLVSQVSAKLALSLDISAPASAVDVAALKVKTTLKNTGDVPLKLFNDPRSILSKAGTNKFNISTGSCEPDFTGSHVVYDPSATNTSDFTVLAPTQAIEFHDQLASTYNFTRCGQGPYEINAFKTFYHVDESGALKEIEASTNSPQITIASAGRPTTISRRAIIETPSEDKIKFIGCISPQRKAIREAATTANTLVDYAYSELHSLQPEKPNRRYTTWFGPYNGERRNNVMEHFSHMKGKATSLTYDCNVCKVTAGKRFLAMDAYVSLASEPRTINLCGKFWDTPVTGTPSRAGVIVRALSQFPENGWVTDHIIDKPKVLELAAVDPGNAVFNAENHRYFAETYFNTIKHQFTANSRD